MDKIRIAVAGCGLIGRRHISMIEKSDQAQLSALADPAPQTEILAAQAKIPAFASLEELLTASRPDAVILATPNHLHFEQAAVCLRAGLPVLVEKPITAQLSEARQLIALANDTRTPLLVGHHRAHSPAIEKAAEIIKAGTLGELVALSGKALFIKPPGYFAAAPWRTVKGGGPVLINMIHEIGSMRRLIGEIRSVQAMASSKVRHHAVEETVAISLEFENGVLGSFLLSDSAASPDSWEQTASEDPAFPHRQDRFAYHIAGTEASLDVPGLRLFSFGPAQEPSWRSAFELSEPGFERADPLVRQLEHFIAVVRGQATPLVSALDGYRNLAVTLAILDAAGTGLCVRPFADRVQDDGRASSGSAH